MVECAYVSEERSVNVSKFGGPDKEDQNNKTQKSYFT